MATTATGTVFPQGPDEWRGFGGILLPHYNVNGFTLDHFNDLFRVLHGFTVPPGTFTSFIWMPFNLSGYFIAHKHFSESFERAHSIPLSWVIGLIGALHYRVWYIWRETDSQGIFKYWQRAYEGPFEKEYITQEIEVSLRPAVEFYSLEINPKEIDIPATVRFFELNDTKRDIIDVLLNRTI
jgi:hypothetical protein